MLSSGLNIGIQLEDFTFSDEVANSRNHNHNLYRRNSPGTVCPQQKMLGNYRNQCNCQLGAYLRLLIWRKDINDSVYCLGGVSSVQCRQNQMTCFGGSNSNLYGFKVTHFTYKDDIRVLPKRYPQRILE